MEKELYAPHLARAKDFLDIAKAKTKCWLEFDVEKIKINVNLKWDTPTNFQIAEMVEKINEAKASLYSVTLHLTTAQNFLEKLL